jgi:hypothetical protein
MEPPSTHFDPLEMLLELHKEALVCVSPLLVAKEDFRVFRRERSQCINKRNEELFSVDAVGCEDDIVLVSRRRLPVELAGRNLALKAVQLDILAHEGQQVLDIGRQDRLNCAELSFDNSRPGLPVLTFRQEHREGQGNHASPGSKLLAKGLGIWKQTSLEQRTIIDFEGQSSSSPI